MAGLGIVDRSLPSPSAWQQWLRCCCCAALAWIPWGPAALLMLGQGQFCDTGLPVCAFGGLHRLRLPSRERRGDRPLDRDGPSRACTDRSERGRRRALLVVAGGWATVAFNSPFPKNFQAFAAATPGCITSDDATTLVQTNSLSRNPESRVPVRCRPRRPLP